MITFTSMVTLLKESKNTNILVLYLIIKVHSIKQKQDWLSRPMFALLDKCRSFQLSVSVQVNLFDKVITPILLYGCEVWGYEKLDIIEKLRLKYLKFVLNVKSSTPSCMVYGELGIHPLEIDVKTRTVKFWTKLVCDQNSKYSSLMYRVLYNLYSNIDERKQRQFHKQFKWFDYTKSILDSCGLSYVWLHQLQGNVNTELSKHVQQMLKDQYVQHWNITIFNSEKCVNYRIFKKDFTFEKYLDHLPAKYRIPLCKLRLSSHSLPIEKGRYINVNRAERYCTLCDDNIVGDEYHFLLECKMLTNQRKQFIKRYYFTRPNIIKFEQLMSCDNTNVILAIAKFTKMCMVFYK